MPLFGHAIQFKSPSTVDISVPYSGWKFGAQKIGRPTAARKAATLMPSPAKDDTKILLSTISCAGRLPYWAIFCPMADAWPIFHQLKSKEMKTFIPLFAADW